MKRTLIICSLIFSCLMLNAQNAGPKISTFRIEDPEILSNSHIELDTEWDFFWGKFVPPYDKNATPDLQVSVPSDWNKYPLDDDIKAICKTGRGSGTYRLLVTNLKPETSYTFPTFEMGYTAFSVYANNKMIFLAGVPSEEWENTYADQPFENAVFTTDKNGSVLLTVFISNEFYRKGGFRGALKLYEEQAYKKIHDRDFARHGIFAGILMMIIIYSFIVFFLKKEKSNLYLAFLVLSIFSRIISSTFPLLKTVFPNIPLPWLLRIEYLSVFFIPGFITLYINSLNKNIYAFISPKLIFAPSIVFFILDFTLPIHLANRMVPFMQIYMYTVVALDIILFFIDLFKEHDFITMIAFLSYAILALGASSNILLIHHVAFVKETNLLPPAFVLFAMFQIVLLAYIQNKNYLKVVELNEHLYNTNQAYYRFVPKEFLALLSKDDITEVKLGEYKISKAAVLSADIRNFTSTSEKLTPIQVFDLLNSYLKKVAPLIRKYNGHIEKYLGDGIIAIFPDSAEAALNCAIEMQEEMISLRKEFEERGMPQIRIGIGVHYGNIVIGTGGNNDRMTEIALSNDIDIAVKTESKTKTFHKPILATYEAINSAAQEARHEGRKFSFCGKKIESDEAVSLRLFSIYNEKTGNVL